MSRSTTTAPQTGKATQTPAATQQTGLPLDKVAALAYQKWVKKGCKHGSDKQDWLEAEAEVKAEMARTGAKK